MHLRYTSHVTRQCLIITKDNYQVIIRQRVCKSGDRSHVSNLEHYIGTRKRNDFEHHIGILKRYAVCGRTYMCTHTVRTDKFSIEHTSTSVGLAIFFVLHMLKKATT